MLALLLVAVASVCACSPRATKERDPSTPTSHRPAPPTADQTKAEISTLSVLVRRHRAVLGQPREQIPRRPSPLCETLDAEQTDCRRLCLAKEQTCTAAEGICKRAEKLQESSWAARKCREARAACRDVRDVCCACKVPERFRAIEIY